MKPFIKAILFLVILTLFDFLLRKGLIASFVPVPLPHNLTFLLLFSAFAACAWLTTKWFARSGQITLNDLGVSLSKYNRLEFYYGLLIGVVLWAIVSLSQSVAAGFSWELRPDINFLNLIYGLVFIFIADLGTELFYRGYPLTKFRESFGAKIAIVIMVAFVGLKSFSFHIDGEILLYTMLIPALHTVFFSFIYFKTKRLGGALGVHTGANFVTISIFDLRVEQPGQAIPAGIFQSDVDLETLSLTALQLPWVIMAVVFSVATYFWWKRRTDIAI